MWHNSTFAVVSLLFASVALGQEKGSREAYEAEARARDQALVSGQANRFAEEAAAFNKVTDAKSFYAAVSASRSHRVKALYDEREKLRSDRKGRKQIAEINRQIVSLNDPRSPTVIPDISSAKVITLGQSEGIRWIRVRQIVDSRNALMESIEGAVGRNNIDFWLTGVDTSGWIDDKNVALTGVLVSAGTKTFETPAGSSRTVPKMKRIEINPEAPELSRKEEIREWTTDAGKKSKGALVLYDFGRVLIMDMNGKKQTLRMKSLSQPDQDFVAANAPVPKSR